MGDSAGDGHLLAAQDELAAPHEADQAEPPHALHPQGVKLDRLLEEICTMGP